jgi:hypothetical protein
VYIKYTFNGVSLLFCKVFGAVALSMNLFLAIEALSVRLRSRLDLFLRRSNALAASLLKGPFLTYSFHEISGFVDGQNMVIFLDVSLRIFQFCKELSDRIIGTNLIMSDYKPF